MSMSEQVLACATRSFTRQVWGSRWRSPNWSKDGSKVCMVIDIVVEVLSHLRCVRQFLDHVVLVRQKNLFFHLVFSYLCEGWSYSKYWSGCPSDISRAESPKLESDPDPGCGGK